MSSRYLLKPPRTLREACRDVRARYPKSIKPGSLFWNCGACPHGEFCAISEQIERDRTGHLAKMDTEAFAKPA